VTTLEEFTQAAARYGVVIARPGGALTHFWVVAHGWRNNTSSFLPPDIAGSCRLYVSCGWPTWRAAVIDGRMERLLPGGTTVDEAVRVFATKAFSEILS
jgi:hypothetical protein